MLRRYDVSASGYDEQIDYIKCLHDGLSQLTTRVHNTVQEITDSGSQMVCYSYLN